MVDSSSAPSFTTFDGHRRIAAGGLLQNALALKKVLESSAQGPVLIFDDATGRTVEVDTRGTDEEVESRLAAWISNAQTTPAEVTAPRGRGRPKLGVVPREITLLPRHWEWLDTQPGGASVALRKLVEDARRQGGEKDKARKAQERAYHFMAALAGDLPGFEEAARALFAHDANRLHENLSTWPRDVSDHVMRLAWGEEWRTVIQRNKEGVQA